MLVILRSAINGSQLDFILTIKLHTKMLWPFLRSLNSQTTPNIYVMFVWGEFDINQEN